MEKLQEAIHSRVEWLAVADRHGHQAATTFVEGDEILDLVSSPKRKRKLQAAIDLAGKKPFRSGTQASKPRAWSAAASGPTAVSAAAAGGATSATSVAQPVPPSGPATRGSAAAVCHYCGEAGHFIRLCPKKGANKLQ